MSEFNGLGFGMRGFDGGSGDSYTYVQRQSPLRGIFAFIGRSIDDVINDPIARQEVRGYFKLHKQIERSCQVTELERQWNSLR